MGPGEGAGMRRVNQATWARPRMPRPQVDNRDVGYLTDWLHVSWRAANQTRRKREGRKRAGVYPFSLVRVGAQASPIESGFEEEAQAARLQIQERIGSLKAPDAKR